MKPNVVAAMLCFVGVVQAHGADLPSPGPLPPASYFPASEYRWSGPYFGLNGGYGFGQSNWTLAGAATGNFNTEGFLFGGTFGANFFQINGFVLGIEGDFDWSTLGGGSSAAACAGIGAPAGAACSTGSHWLSTGRARAGYAFGPVLLYGTGGVAFSNIELGATSIGSGTFPAWTAGGGVEVAFADQWTAKVEYLFVDFGNMTCGGTSQAPVVCGTGGVSLTENVVRGGVNWKFHW